MANFRRHALARKKKDAYSNVLHITMSHMSLSWRNTKSNLSGSGIKEGSNKLRVWCQITATAAALAADTVPAAGFVAGGAVIFMPTFVPVASVTYTVIAPSCSCICWCSGCCWCWCYRCNKHYCFTYSSQCIWRAQWWMIRSFDSLYVGYLFVQPFAWLFNYFFHCSLFCLPICLFLHQLVCTDTSQFTCLSVFIFPEKQFVCLFFCLFCCLFISLLVRLSFFLFACFLVRLFVCLLGFCIRCEVSLVSFTHW